MSRFEESNILDTTIASNEDTQKKALDHLDGLCNLLELSAECDGKKLIYYANGNVQICAEMTVKTSVRRNDKVTLCAISLSRDVENLFNSDNSVVCELGFLRTAVKVMFLRCNYDISQ